MLEFSWYQHEVLPSQESLGSLKLLGDQIYPHPLVQNRVLRFVLKLNQRKELQDWLERLGKVELQLLPEQDTGLIWFANVRSAEKALVLNLSNETNGFSLYPLQVLQKQNEDLNPSSVVLFGFDPAKPLDLLYDLIRPWGALRYLRQKQDTRLEVSFWSQMDADKWAKEWNVMIFEGKELSTEQSDKIENDPVSLLMSRTRDIETRRTSWKVEEHVSRKSPPVQVIRNPPKMAEHKSIQTVANLMENKTSQTNTNVSWSDRSTQTELMPASKDASSQTDMVHARPRPICELTQPFGSTSHNDIDRLLLRWSRTADIHPDSVAELTMYSADEVWKYLAFLGDGGTKGRLAGLSKMDDEMMGLTLSWLSREKDEGDTRRVICEKLTKLSRAWGYKQHSRAVAENFLSKGDPWSILLLMKCHPYIMRGMIARAGKNGPPSV